MLIIGLTGGIGMGKTTTAGMFHETGMAVHDADATVHALYRGPAVPAVEAAFPGTTGPDGVDREKLAAAVVGQPDKLRQLESIIHPMVRAEELAVRDRAAKAGARALILDIPLLFETGAEARCDLIVVVTADAGIQRERVLARPGMTAEKLDALMNRQWSDRDRRMRAHFLVDTTHGYDSARRQVRDIVRAITMVNG